MLIKDLSIRTAIEQLDPTAGFELTKDNVLLNWNSSVRSQPTEAETDWWGLKETDGRMMTQEQKDYRNALRDLPSTSTPSLDSYGNLENVTWPVKPE